MAKESRGGRRGFEGEVGKTIKEMLGPRGSIPGGQLDANDYGPLREGEAAIRGLPLHRLHV